MANAKEIQDEWQRCPECNDWLKTTVGESHVVVSNYNRNHYSERYFCSVDCVGRFYNDD